MLNACELRLSPRSCQYLSVAPGQNCPLVLGTKHFTAIIKPADSSTGDPGIVSLSRQAARQLGLPGPFTLRIRAEGSSLRLGPMVGILSTRGKPGALFGEQEGYFKNLLLSLQSLYGFGYVFTREGIDWEQGVIKGYYLKKPGKEWGLKAFPLPDLVYNRCFGGGRASSSGHLSGRLAALGIKTFNSELGSKWRVHQHLAQRPPGAAALPETEILNSLESLRAMLNKHSEVYIKTLDGHLGRGIIRITRVRSGYLVKRTGESRGRLVKNLAWAVQQCGIDKGFGRLIIQQSIKTSSSSSHYDARVLVQKDRSNRWQVTGIAARIGQAGQITTNLHTGGQAQDLGKALASRGYSQARAALIEHRLKQAALQTAESLESASEYLGDLGLDFVVDKSGQPWFLEANPRAGRRSFARMKKITRRLAVQRPMEYACWLAGYELGLK